MFRQASFPLVTDHFMRPNSLAAPAGLRIQYHLIKEHAVLRQLHPKYEHPKIGTAGYSSV